MSSLKIPRTIPKKLPPLTAEEHLKLQNPADVAYVKLAEGNGDRSDLWTLWFRMESTKRIVQQHARHVYEQFAPIADAVEAFFIACYQNPDMVSGISASETLLGDIYVGLDLANQVQRQINRNLQFEAYRQANAYCKEKAQALSRELYLRQHAVETA